MTQLAGLIGAILLGVLANDIWALSAPLARRLVVLAARLWSRDHEQAQVLSEEWRAYIDDRPGQILKLCTACAFLAAAVGRSAGRLFQALSPRGKPILGLPSWVTSVDFAAARTNAVAVALLVGLICSVAPLACYAAGLDVQWALLGWAVGVAVAVVAVTASVTAGFFVAQQHGRAPHSAVASPLAHIVIVKPETAEVSTAANAPLVRPFIIHIQTTRPTEPAESGLVRPYVDLTPSSHIPVTEDLDS